MDAQEGMLPLLQEQQKIRTKILLGEFVLWLYEDHQCAICKRTPAGRTVALDPSSVTKMISDFVEEAE